MGYIFEFFIGKDDGSKQKPYFSCPLVCVQCLAKTPSGAQCSKKTCIGTPYCYIHLLYLKKLRIKESTIPGAGKGLFVQSKKDLDNAVVFKKGDDIIEYDGQYIQKNIYQKRYGEMTAPYGLDQPGEDGACRRGVGTLVNHSMRPNARFYKKGKKMRLEAIKDIKNNSEIMVYYGENYRFKENAFYRTRYARR